MAMNWSKLFTSSIGKKIVMALTGIFLVVFLVVHCYVNANVFFSNAEENFNRAAHFMGTNILIRITEIGLFAGFILHIVQGYKLWLQNKAARKSRYAVSAGNKNSKWYSRSMALLGTLILLFLIVHLVHFWVPSRFGGLDPVIYNGIEHHNLYAQMKNVFAEPIWVILYLIGCFSLSWHLLHGIQSAAQTMGWTSRNFFPTIKAFGIIFAILVPLIFALMPLFMHFGWQINTGDLTLLF
jgi:succinate dehydrogenase / fumarate reductase cytochrome b subunit